MNNGCLYVAVLACLLVPSAKAEQGTSPTFVSVTAAPHISYPSQIATTIGQASEQSSLTPKLGPSNKHPLTPPTNSATRTSTEGSIPASVLGANSVQSDGSDSMHSKSRIELGAKFPGVSIFEAASLGYIYTPPDTHGVTNGSLADTTTQSKHPSSTGLFMEIVNSHVDIYDELRGDHLFGEGASEFLGIPIHITDTRAIFDARAERWIITAVIHPGFDQVTMSTTGGIVVGASLTDDPTGPWVSFVFRLPTASGSPYQFGDWVDYDLTGENINSVIVAGNVFSVSDPSRFTHAVFTIPKASLYAAAANNAAVIQLDYPGTITPPVVLDDSPTAYLLANNTASPGLSNILGFFALDTSDVANPTISETDINIPQRYADPPPAPQPGTSIVLSTIDSRFKNAGTQQGGKLWAVHDATLDGIRTSPQFFEIDTQTASVVQEGSWNVSATSSDFNASIAANAVGDAFVTWTSVDAAAGTNAEVRASGRCHSDAKGLIASPGLSVFQSPTFANQGTSGNVSRWGDFSAVSLDQSADGMVAWFVNERIVSEGEWGTEIGSVTSKHCGDKISVRED